MITPRARFSIRRADAKNILSATSGFIAEAGFTHSLNPARNCTYGCIYCYVPTLRIYAGLQPEDWQRWGQFTTFKTNAPDLLRSALRPEQIIYCSPLVDPYQPAEQTERLMPALIEALTESPPKVFVIQTRGPGILRDLDALLGLAKRTTLRVSFSLTTDREEVRLLYEPHCAPVAERLATLRALRDAGIAAYATLAPILPCDPEALAVLALESTDRDIIADPFHVRAVKRLGATTRKEAVAVSRRHGFQPWHEPAFQQNVVNRIRRTLRAAGRGFAVGTEGFACLSRP